MPITESLHQSISKKLSEQVDKQSPYVELVHIINMAMPKEKYKTLLIWTEQV
jgi:hypothetical protein